MQAGAEKQGDKSQVLPVVSGRIVIFYHRLIIELIALTVHHAPLYEGNEKCCPYREIYGGMELDSGFEGCGAMVAPGREE